MWESWIGKPHGFMADPAIEDRADCLLMTIRVREGMGLSVPTPQELQTLFSLASRRKHVAVMRMLDETTAPAGLEDGAFCVTLSGRLGVSVIVSRGLLFIDHEKGVCWTPLEAIENLKQLEWRHWK